MNFDHEQAKVHEKTETNPQGAGARGVYRPGMAETAFKLALLGLTDAQMANLFGVVESTFHKWKHDHPDFAEQLYKGKDLADAEVAASLYRSACTGDTRAAEFWLSRRRRDLFGDQKQVDLNISDPVSLMTKRRLKSREETASRTK